MEDRTAQERFARLEARLAKLEEENRVLERVKDVQDIQNVFALHEHYHFAGRHGDEMEAIWALRTPGLAMEEAHLGGRYVGLEAVRQYYVDFFDGSLFGGMRAEMRALYPDAEQGPDSGQPIGVRILHTLTTPLIEVAEDRQTAKAVWLSPGHITTAEEGKLRAFWHWDRYAVDFAREESGWKIWHLWVGTDFHTPYERSWVDDFFAGAKIDFASVPGFPKPNAPSLLAYSGYSAFERAPYIPPSPVPYRTFSETFSY